MMKKEISTDQWFRKTMMDDQPDIAPEKAIEDRLNQYFLVKQSTRKVHANSFSGMFLWLFSMKAIGLKAGFASVSMAYFLFFGNMNTSMVEKQYADTCQLNPVVIDSSFISKDTCSK